MASRSGKGHAAVTAEQVARIIGLSQSTVSRAFTNPTSVRPKTRELVIETAKSLGYQPNVIARSLITRRTNIIALVLANLTDPFYPTVLEALSLRIQASGRQVLFFIIPPGKG